MSRYARVAFIVLGTSWTGLLADEGRIPIFQPTTINKPGSYILTRDIEVAAGDIITIAAKQVTFDLNGHTLRSTSASNTLVAIDPAADLITIRNGRMSGGQFGVRAASVVGLNVLLEGLEIDNVASSAVFMSGVNHAELLRSTLLTGADGGFTATGVGSAPVTGRVVGNAIRRFSRCVSLPQARGMEIRNNVVSDCTFRGIEIGALLPSGHGGNLIQENTVAASVNGIHVNLSAAGTQIIGNVLRQNQNGIVASSPANRIAGNTVEESTGPCAGVCLSGPRNLVEGNQIDLSNPGCGIQFSGATATGNAYRNNMLGDNAGGDVCINAGATAVDAGGNIF